jgi:hypothetical protein
MPTSFSFSFSTIYPVTFFDTPSLVKLRCFTPIRCNVPNYGHKTNYALETPPGFTQKADIFPCSSLNIPHNKSFKLKLLEFNVSLVCKVLNDKPSLRIQAKLGINFVSAAFATYGLQFLTSISH